jgi:hypothetical protein
MHDTFFKDGAKPGMARSPGIHTIYEEAAQIEHF